VLDTFRDTEDVVNTIAREETMPVLKGIALGSVFSFAGTIGYLLLGLVISIIRGPVVTTGPAHAIGLSAVLGGLLEATVFNPFYWLGILAAFGLAFWLTRAKVRAA